MYIYTAENTSEVNGFEIVAMVQDPLYKLICQQPMNYGVSGRDGLYYSHQTGRKKYEISNHLGNVHLVVSDKKVGQDSLASQSGDGFIDHYTAQVVDASDYYPFGWYIQDRKIPLNAVDDGGYRFGFNGKEKDDEVKGCGNSLDFGERKFDPRIGRWLSTDPLQTDYPCISSYAFALNSPIQAFDPDGRLVIFVNGLMLSQAISSDNRLYVSIDPMISGALISNPNYRPYPTNEMSVDGPTYLGETFSYWGDVSTNFNERFHDFNSLYVSGSNHTWSEASERYKAGQQSGYELIAKIQSGEITLGKDETIKLVGHSQGAAHAAGMASVLKQAYDDGIIANSVEQIYYLAPHQATEINSPEGVFSVQYMRRSDLVSSTGLVSTEAISGGSYFGELNGVTEFVTLPNMTGKGNGILGTRGGHDVNTYNEIFSIPLNTFGSVRTSAPKHIGPLQEDGTF